MSTQPLLSFVVDDAVVNWIASGLAVAFPIAIAVARSMWIKFIAWSKPMIEHWWTEQTSLISTLNSQVPIVNETLRKIGESQDRHSEKLDLLLKKHETIGH